MKNRKTGGSSNSASENARKAMIKRSKKNTSDPNMPYYLVIGGFVVIMATVIIYTVFINPKESFLKKQIIDDDEFLIHNSQNQFFTVGPNKQFEGMQMDDARKVFNIGIADTHNLPTCEPPAEVEIPDNYDWRKSEKGAPCVDEPRTIGNCTAGHVLSILSTIEDRICMANNGEERFRLSAQDAVSCDQTNYHCDGGYVTHTLNYGRDQGFIREECFPYTGTNTTCPAELNECRKNKEQYMLMNYCIVQGPNAIKAEIMKNGPVVSPMAPYTDFLTYQDGTYFPSEGAFKFNGQQAVKIVGWEQSAQGTNWIIENTWGKEWGIDGYAKVVSGHSELGLDYFGIAPRAIPMPFHQWEKELAAYKKYEKSVKVEEEGDGEEIEIDE